MPRLPVFALTILTCILTLSFNAFAQRPEGGRSGGQRPGGAAGVFVTGTVVDDGSGSLIEYANVVLHRSADSSMAQGTISDRDGRFVLRGIEEGDYYLVIHFIGYEDHIVPEVSVRQGRGRIDLGEIRLSLVPIAMDEVEVAADRAPVVYQLDKKIINVDRQLTAASGTAVDVLKNVPSVTVDLDGSVSLRGSGSFTVLIDGRPSVLEGSEALQQIPSSAIENIEIITNPSARFNPEGMSGIINVVLKKGGTLGSSGLVNASVGTGDRYSADGLYTYRHNGMSLYAGAEFRHHNDGSDSRSERSFLNPEGISTVNSSGRSNRLREGWSLRGGADLPVTENDIFTLGFRVGDRGHSGTSELDYVEQSPGSPAEQYISKGVSERGGYFYSGDVDYRHTFGEKEHQLIGQFSYRSRSGEESSVDELLDMNGTITSGRRTTEDGPGARMDGKVEYVRPLGEKRKVTAGYEGRFGKSEDVTTLADYDPATGDYVIDPAFNRSTTYQRGTQGLYGEYADVLGPFGLQAGMRAEYTDRTVSSLHVQETSDLRRWDYFPTLHTSYSISGTQQFMASYTRRIEHTRGYFLEPFETWMDAYNVRRGNPNLLPEYIDSYEAGYQTHLGESLLSAEVYHRRTTNKLEFVRSVYAGNVTLHQPENVGTDYATGLELMLNMDLFTVWDVYLLGNLYDYRIEGGTATQDFSQRRFTWNVRFNNTFRLAENTQLQINASYSSPSVSAQGRTEGYAVLNMAVRQDFFDRQLAATLDVRDVLSSAERESTHSGPDFSSYQYSFHDAPVAMLTLRWFINRAQNERRGREGGQDREMGDDDL